MSYQYIFTMQNLRKVYPPNNEILKGIYLSFLPGAKIGVLGLNGSGKSTILKIMAGIDTDFSGDARPADGVRVGYLAQEPQLDPTKNVVGNVETAVAEVRALLDRFDAINERLGEPLDADEMTAVLDEQAAVVSTVISLRDSGSEHLLDAAIGAATRKRKKT